jgi:hypothetical protein
MLSLFLEKQNTGQDAEKKANCTDNDEILGVATVFYAMNMLDYRLFNIFNDRFFDNFLNGFYLNNRFFDYFFHDFDIINDNWRPPGKIPSSG